MIGMRELRREKLLIDYQHAKLEIHRGPWRLAGAGVHEAPLRQVRGCPALTVEIGGHPRSLLIDTGDNCCLTLQTSFFETLVAEGFIVRIANQLYISALGADTQRKAGRFVKGELMGKSLAGVEVATGGSIESGDMGLAWLCAFSMEIAVEEGTVRYRAVPHPRPPICFFAMMGFMPQFEDGKVMVAHLTPGGPAAQAGLAEGDAIEQLGKLPATELEKMQFPAFADENAGRKVAIKYRRKSDGREVESSLRLLKRLDFWHALE